MKQRIFFVVAMLVLGALILAWQLSATAPPPDPSEQPPRAATTPPPTPSDGTTRAVRGGATTVFPPLPPSDTSLPELAALLQPRADAGDSLAACRLGVELLRCDYNDYMVAFTQRHSARDSIEAEEKGQLGTANLIDERQLHGLELQLQCDQLPAELRARADDYLVQAARAGEPEAMLRYAGGQHWGINLDDFLADPGFDDWRRDAPGMLHRALEAGDPRAAFELYSAYSEDFSPGSGLVDDDPVLALAYRMLYFRLLGRPQPPTQLGAEEVARAEALAKTWHRTHLGNRRFDKDVFLSHLRYEHNEAQKSEICQRPSR